MHSKTLYTASSGALINLLDPHCLLCDFGNSTKNAQSMVMLQILQTLFVKIKYVLMHSHSPLYKNQLLSNAIVGKVFRSLSK